MPTYQEIATLLSSVEQNFHELGWNSRGLPIVLTINFLDGELSVMVIPIKFCCDEHTYAFMNDFGADTLPSSRVDIKAAEALGVIGVCYVNEGNVHYVRGEDAIFKTLESDLNVDSIPGRKVRWLLAIDFEGRMYSVTREENDAPTESAKNTIFGGDLAEALRQMCLGLARGNSQGAEAVEKLSQIRIDRPDELKTRFQSHNRHGS